MIFGINTTSDISKLLYVISRAFRRVKFETILKYHEWCLCQTTRTNHAIIYLYYFYLIFTCRYFKLSWNPTALSQSNCRNFSCSRITFFTSSQEKQDRILHQFCLFLIKRVPWNCQNNLSKMVSLISDWWKSQKCSSSLIHMARLMINHGNHILIVIH